MAFAMKAFLLLLLAFLSAPTCVDCDCGFRLSSCYPDAGESATCRNNVCSPCPDYRTGDSAWIQIPASDGDCGLACTGATPAGDLACSLFGGTYCFATTSVLVKKSNGDVVTMAGICGSCKEGYVLTAARDGCTLAESLSPPIFLYPPPANASPPPPAYASPPPPASRPPSGIPPGSPPPSGSPPGSPPSSGTPPGSLTPSGTPPGSAANSTGGSSPPVTPTSSNEQKKKSAFPKHLKYVLSIAIPAVAAGIIGLFFFFCQNRISLAAERRKSPLASAVRSQLKLKGVDDFKATLGLQYCTSIEMLAEGLRSSGYIKAPALLGHDTRYLAAAMAAALKQRYESDVSNNQKGFLARFAHDCNDEASLGSLVFDVEEKIRANEGWSRRLAAPPKGSSARYAAAPSPPPDSRIPVGIPAPHFPVAMRPPPMMPPAPPPQNPRPWTPSAPPFDHYPPPTAPYPQTRQ